VPLARPRSVPGDVNEGINAVSVPSKILINARRCGLFEGLELDWHRFHCFLR
jgi:hypothetical protein